MTSRLSAFHPLSWSLWVKFLLGIALGLIVLAIPIYLFIRAGVYDLSAQNAGSFVNQLGIRHATAVDRAFVQARTLLDGFTSDGDNQRVLTGFLLRDVQTPGASYLPTFDSDAVIDLFRSRLLNPAAASFDSVRLLDRRGRSLLSSGLTSFTTNPIDESVSPAYLAIRGAELQGQASATAVSGARAPTVELIATIYWRDGSPLGYVVATLNNGRIFNSNMRLDDLPEKYPAYTFLGTPQGILIAPPASRALALRANRSVAVDDALDGQSGVQMYFANDGVDYIGYYTPIGGTPFVLVAQMPISAIFESAQEFFQVRGWVVAAGVLLLLLVLAALFSWQTAAPLSRLRRAIQAFAEGDLDVDVRDARRGDEIGQAAATFVNMRDQARALIDDLETRVATRTRDISATQEISHFAAAQRDLQTLMDRVVDLIIERFPNIYHAQIFLIDADGNDAVLRASTGEVGQQLLSRGHRLGIGSLSVIGQVTQQGRLIVARDAASSQIHRRNEFLPDTRAELAVPLRVGETVIGALDVQSKIRDAFEEDLIAVLQTMADQIAVAIQNALLYEESLRRFAEIEASNRDATRRAWQEFSRDQRMDAIVREAGYPTETNSADLRQAALERGETVIGKMTERRTVPIAVPVMLRGQVLGAVEWEIPAQSLSEEKLELAKELANRLALSLDNARLFQESQRATERERLVNNIAAKLTAQTSINDILQTAVREVGQALRSPQVSIRLSGAAGSGSGSSGGNGNGSAHADTD
jgi:GAF domain-containing protein/HAMP domain-containing protein